MLFKKKVLLNVSQISQENTSVGVSLEFLLLYLQVILFTMHDKEAKGA